MVPEGVNPKKDPRQGEYWFVEVPSPLQEKLTFIREYPLREQTRYFTDAGYVSDYSRKETRWEFGRFSRTHHASECLHRVDSENTAFIGRKGSVKTHGWTAHSKFYVRGAVEHVDHGTLQLDMWHECVPNKAHGPFPVGGAGAEVD